MIETLGYTALGIVTCAVAVWAVMKRLTWEDRRNPTRAMKRGEASQWWLLVLVLPVAGVVAVKTGHTDLARWCVALTLGLPLLTLTENDWTRSAMTFTAKYGGLCQSCPEPIRPGDEIRGAVGDGFVHAECPEDVEPKPTKFQGTSLEDMGY